MYIRVLEITDLRVIERIRIEPAAGLNFIVGENGSGKTSLLEGIYLASRGRTFRHAEAGPMIRFGAEQTTVVAHLAPDRVDGSADESGAILGVRRGKQSLLCRLNGSDVRKRSELAEALPVQWIGSQPQLLISMGPEVRRRFVDMGLFHVEPPYLRAYAEFQRTLQQRNAAIRQGSREQVSLWSTPLLRPPRHSTNIANRSVNVLFAARSSCLANGTRISPSTTDFEGGGLQQSTSRKNSDARSIWT